MEKLLRNEKAFEDVNARLAIGVGKLAPSLVPVGFTISLYCECANKACQDRFDINYRTYTKIKKIEAAFVVKPDHYLPQFESLLSKHKEYWIIQKKLEMLDVPFEV
jgi:hypothetical protein